MNEEIISGVWKVIKGKIKEQWSKLSDEQIESLNGKLTQLGGMIQVAYGYSKERAQSDIEAFKRGFEKLNERTPAPVRTPVENNRPVLEIAPIRTGEPGQEINQEPNPAKKAS